MNATPAAVQHNRKAHDDVAAQYEGIHHEIYNPTEQHRLSITLQEALSHLPEQEVSPTILDLGAGTGNLTAHLLQAGAHVVAADVSQNCLQFVMAKFAGNMKLETFQLNGNDLSEFPDNTFDMVATYSVLHHIPDYPGIVSEMVRTTKPDGLIFIDHEKCPSFWLGASPEYVEYRRQLRPLFHVPPGVRLQRKFLNCFSIKAWRRLINKTFFSLNPEGDIHVYRHDHVEWDQVQGLLEKGCDPVKIADYLLCEERSFPAPVYEHFKTRCADMRYVIYRKRNPRTKHDALDTSSK